MKTKIEVKDTKLGIPRLAKRIALKTVPINNSSLPAGSPMYFYCHLCGVLCDTKEERYLDMPKPYCKDCEDLRKVSGVTDEVLREIAAELQLP